MSRSLAPLKTREYVSLLKDWGFTETDPGGNHPMFLSPDGKRFPISTPGKVTMAELRQAARLVGVNSRAFLKGPPKKKPMRRVVDEIRAISAGTAADLHHIEDQLHEQLNEQLEQMVATATQRAKEKEMARVVNDRPIIEQIKQVFIDRPHDHISISEILGKLPINYSQLGGPLKRLADAGIITKVDTGTYRLAVSPSEAAEMRGMDKRHAKKREAAVAVASNGSTRNGHATIDVLSYVEANPGKVLSLQSVSDATGVAPGTVGHILRKAMATMTDLKLVSRGVYLFDPAPRERVSFSDETPVVSTPTAIEPEPAPEPTVANQEPVATVLWEQMQDLGDDRYLLRDDSGKLWVAKMKELGL